VPHRGQGIALKAVHADGREAVQCQCQVGEVAKEAEADVAPINPGGDVLVHRGLDPAGDLVPREHREDEEQDEEEREQGAEDAESAFHAV
jgi:hypothetical protein